LGLLFLNKLFSRLFFQEVFFMSEFMKAGDPVWISPYDVTWPERFAQLAQPLCQALGPVAWRIDHIGSTAVAGLAAKPVIDIQISVADFEPLDAYRLPLERLGYIFRADNPNRTERYFREAPGHPRVHIHVKRAGSFGEQFALLFRDYVRKHPDVVSQYAQLKIGLAQQYSQVEDRAAYTEAKRPFIWKVIAQADEWAQQTGWLPDPSDA
jgi:GrpB-like predicted nucleotidyltransferase (UPF0157 family)